MRFGHAQTSYRNAHASGDFSKVESTIHPRAGISPDVLDRRFANDLFEGALSLLHRRR